MNTYILSNREGCKMSSVTAKSYKSAREYFKSKYQGKFILSWYESDNYCLDDLKSKNIVL